MSMPIIIQGTLQPDGTLRLDQPPNLPPGPVVVTVLPAKAVAPSQQGLADVIDDIQRGQQSRGYQGRSAAEIESLGQGGEAEYEQRMRALHPQTAPAAAAGDS